MSGSRRYSKWTIFFARGVGSLPLLPRDPKVFEIPLETDPKLSLSLSLPYAPFRSGSSGAKLFRWSTAVVVTTVVPLLAFVDK